MSVEDTGTNESPVHIQNDFTLLHGIGENSGDVLECLSVMVNNDQADSDNAQVQGIILDDHPLLGTTLTAITLPDGTQAFVANNTESSLNNEKDSPLNLETPRRILIRDLSDFPDGKTLEFQLQPSSLIETEAGPSNSSDNTYSQVEFVDGTTYMLTSQEDDEEFWEIENGKLKKRETNVIKKFSDTKSQHHCPREGCTKVYSTPHHLKVHERSHTGLRPYECSHPKCKKSFSTGYSLKAHLRTHTGEKPYKCTAESCNKSFKTSGDLLKHVRTHTGERPFVCPFSGCGRSFTTSNIRKVHVRTHTGERPYKCSQCPKAFASATNYKNHVRIHSGEKPYACSIENCDKRFTEYSSLYKHHLVHTQQKPFECNLCHKRYRQSSTLVMHKRTAHALVESADGMDIFLQACNDTGRVKNIRRNNAKRSKFTVNEDGQLQISEATEDSDDNKTQILFVGDPSQLAALQQMSLEEAFDEGELNPGLEELNVKIDDMEFGWH